MSDNANVDNTGTALGTGTIAPASSPASVSMSETTTSADGSTTTETTTATAESSVNNHMAHFFTAMRNGAAYIYHEVVETEGRVTKWLAGNEQVASLIQEGVQVGCDFLQSYGVPVPAFEIAARAVISALHEMAASDPTVKSGNSAKPAS